MSFVTFRHVLCLSAAGSHLSHLFMFITFTKKKRQIGIKYIKNTRDGAVERCSVMLSVLQTELPSDRAKCNFAEIRVNK